MDKLSEKNILSNNNGVVDKRNRILQITETNIRISNLGSLEILHTIPFSLNEEQLNYFLDHPIPPPALLSKDNTNSKVIGSSPSICHTASSLHEYLEGRDIAVIVPFPKAYHSTHRKDASSSSSHLNAVDGNREGAGNRHGDFLSLLVCFLFHPSIGVNAICSLMSDVAAISVAVGAPEESVVVNIDVFNLTIAHVKAGSTSRHALTRLGSLQHILGKSAGGEETLKHYFAGCDRGEIEEINLCEEIYREGLVSFFGPKAYRYMLQKMKTLDTVMKTEENKPIVSGKGKGKGQWRRKQTTRENEAELDEEGNLVGDFSKLLARVVGKAPYLDLNPSTQLRAMGMVGSHAFLSAAKERMGKYTCVISGEALLAAPGLRFLVEYACLHECNENVLQEAKQDAEEKLKIKKKLQQTLSKEEDGLDGSRKRPSFATSSDGKEKTATNKRQRFEVLESNEKKTERRKGAFLSSDDDSGSTTENSSSSTCSEESDSDSENEATNWLHIANFPLLDSHQLLPIVGSNIVSEISFFSQDKYAKNWSLKELDEERLTKNTLPDGTSAIHTRIVSNNKINNSNTQKYSKHCERLSLITRKSAAESKGKIALSRSVF